MRESRLKSSILLRMLIIASLTLLLLIPTVIVESVIRERSERRDSAINEISDKWGLPQTITGPILSVPIRYYTTDDKGKEIALIDVLHILPDSLTIGGRLATETRSRGIYEAILYNATLTFSGEFVLDDVPMLHQEGRTPMWSDAVMTVGISDPRGIKNDLQMIVNRETAQAGAGVPWTHLVSSGVTFKPVFSPAEKKYIFAFPLSLNGSSEILFTPVGRRTAVSLHSSWPTPSFTGAYLPEKKTMEESGFSSQWNVLELNRNFPQYWTNKSQDIAGSSFGVRLLRPVDEYQKTIRTAKYALLVISLTFLAFFLSEVLSRELLHPVHYVLIGFSLVLFYLLVLALSEHMGFNAAYFSSAGAILSLIGLYSLAIAARRRTSGIVTSILAVVYVFLYVVLENEDYALLIGSLGLLVIMAVVMYLTRKVDWYAVRGPEQNP